MTHPTAGMDAPWLLTGLTMGGAVLAGSALMVLKRRREQQFRARRPGRAIAAPDPVLAPVAKTIATAGSVSAPTVRFMDEALRRLATTQLSGGDAMPPVVAVQLTDDAMVLHLENAIELDEPWECDDGTGLAWSLTHDTPLDDVGPTEEGQPSPYPLLVTSGTSDDGDLWLLNFERLATVRVTGDTTFGHDFLRYLAAELAVNPWSRDATITCVGVASEVRAMNPERFSQTTSIEQASTEVLADAVATLTRARQTGTDTATARSGQLGDEAWGARLMIIDADSAHDETLHRLVTILEAQPTMTATAVVVGGETGAVSGPELRFSSQGRVTAPHLGLDLVAVGLTGDEARGCAALLAHADLAGDAPMPVTVDATQGWRSYGDDAGALRDELTVPRTVPDHDLIEPAHSLLDPGDTTLPLVAPEEDLAELDPKVPVHVREEVEQSDPTLDADVADWFAGRCDRPRLALLGPVSVRAHGAPIAKRKPYYTEVLAYIALRENGATSDEIADAFGHSASTTRSSVKKVRDWLGTNPRTGEPHLPDATRSRAAQQRGVPVYQVEDLLVDVDLFRRLRLRGQARGAEGIPDLVTALRLVTGRPFDQLRPGGWSWLLDMNIDNHMICAIVDVAHILSIHFLQNDEVGKARAATETALLAAPFDTIPKLDLAAVTKAEGHIEEARRIVHEHVCNVPDEDGSPMDVGDRVEEILASLDWLNARAS